MAEMEPGTEFGGYRIERTIGSGGFCTVYLAEDLRPALRRKVALKVLNPTLSADDKNRERFQRESLLAVELDDHPNIVGVLDAGEQDGQLFIAQRFIEGHDFSEEISRAGAVEPTRAVEVLTEIAGALDYAHEAGLVHRDVKPRNILIRERDQRAYLADFGLTKRTASSDSLTGAGEFLGTFAYAAPEQLGGEPVDGRADIYALGCVLYEALTGGPPFSGDIHSMITSHLTKAPPRLSEVVTGLPPAIDAVIETAMAKAPADRYQTGHEFAEAARRALLSSGLPPPAVTPPPPPSSSTVVTPIPAVLPTEGGSSAPSTSGGFAVTPDAEPAHATAQGFTTPPPGASGPTSSGSAGGAAGGSKTPLLIGGIVVLVLAVIAGVLLLGGGDDGGEEVVTTTTADDGEDLEQAQDDAEGAFDELPSALAAACELGDVEDYDDDVVADIACEPDDGADEVAVTVYNEDDDAADAFADAQDAAAEPLDEEGDCETDRYATHPWSAADEPDEIVGQVACYLDEDEESELVWTIDDQSLVAVAHRGDDGDAALYRWWADLVERAAAEDGDAFPNDAEEELLSHVPTEFRDGCTRADLRPGETASVRCEPATGASVVFYNQYPTGAAAIQQYEELRNGEGIDRAFGDSNGCPYEGRLTVGEETRGRVFCSPRDGNNQILVWANRPLAIQAEATIAAGGTMPQFWEWWTTAGPT